MMTPTANRLGAHPGPNLTVNDNDNSTTMSPSLGRLQSSRRRDRQQGHDQCRRRQRLSDHQSDTFTNQGTITVANGGTLNICSRVNPGDRRLDADRRQTIAVSGSRIDTNCGSAVGKLDRCAEADP